MVHRSEVLLYDAKSNANLRRWYTARSENLLANGSVYRQPRSANGSVYRQPGGAKVCVCNEVKHKEGISEKPASVKCALPRTMVHKVQCEWLCLLAYRLPTVHEPKPDTNHFNRTWPMVWRFGWIWCQTHSKCLTLWSGYVSPLGKAKRQNAYITSWKRPYIYHSVGPKWLQDEYQLLKDILFRGIS